MKSGNGQLLVNTQRSGFQLINEEKHPVTYLGYLGGYFVVYEVATESVVLIKQKEQTPMVLYTNPKRN